MFVLLAQELLLAPGQAGASLMLTSVDISATRYIDVIDVKRVIYSHFGDNC